MFVTGGSTVKPYEFYTQAARRVSRKRVKKRTHFLRLDSVASNKNAVFQLNLCDIEIDSSPLASFQPMQAHTADKTSIVTVLPEDATGHIHMSLRKRTSSTDVVPHLDVLEQKVVPRATSEDVTVTSTTHKVSRVSAESRAKAHATARRTRMNLRKRYTHKAMTPTTQKLSLYSGCNVEELKCLKCNTKYLTPKTLSYHMSNAHAERRHFFPCLYCGRTFSQLWGTTRHLRLIHHKTDTQVEKLRPKLKKLAYSQSVEELGRKVDLRATHPATTGMHQSTSSHGRSNKRCKVSVPPPPRTRPASKQHCSENDVATGKDSTQPEQIVFSSAFSLHVCASCKQVFGRKNLLDSHVSTCHQNAGPPALVLPTKKGRPVSSTLLKQPVATTTASPEKTSPALTVANDDPLVGISESDLARICAMVDDTKLVCLKCHRHYGTTSNLHRHAVRHLGWRRFKCKLCRYTAYNRSECTSHLHRVHTASVVTHTKAEIENLILDLEPEKMKRERPALSRVDLRTIHGVTTLPTQRNTLPVTKSSYNISTRRHARIFNTKPYGWPKLNTAVLCTRSGVYRKPVFSVATSRSDSNSPTEDGDRRQDTVIPAEDHMTCHVLNKCGIKTESNSDGAVDNGGVAAGRNSSSNTVHCQPQSNNCVRESTECATNNGGAKSMCKTSMSIRDCTDAASLCTTKDNSCDKTKASTTEVIICAAAHANCGLTDTDCVRTNGGDTAETKQCPIKAKECVAENDHECKTASTTSDMPCHSQWQLCRRLWNYSTSANQTPTFCNCFIIMLISVFL